MLVRRDRLETTQHVIVTYLPKPGHARFLRPLFIFYVVGLWVYIKLRGSWSTLSLPTIALYSSSLNPIFSCQISKNTQFQNITRLKLSII